MNEIRGGSKPALGGNRAVPALILVVVAMVAGLWLAVRVNSPEAMAYLDGAPSRPVSPTAPATTATVVPTTWAAPTDAQPTFGGSLPAFPTDPQPTPTPPSRSPSLPPSQKPSVQVQVESVVVPSLLQSSVAEARQRLEAAGWSGILEVRQSPTTGPVTVDGLIVRQDPQPDDFVDPGTTMTVWVAVVAGPTASQSWNGWRAAPQTKRSFSARRSRRICRVR